MKHWLILFVLMIPLTAEAAEKKVITNYDDFLQIIAKIEHSEKLRNKAMAENGVLIKLNGEKDTIIKIQADQIQACEKIVQQQEQLGSTQEQINQAVEATLTEMTQRLEREQAQHKWYTLGGAGVGGILVLVIMAVVN
jgi:sensor c-di-GMP phosphodiesterase-like protein